MSCGKTYVVIGGIACPEGLGPYDISNGVAQLVSCSKCKLFGRPRDAASHVGNDEENANRNCFMSVRVRYL